MKGALPLALTLVLTAVPCAFADPAGLPPGDYGDAPEGVLAYPATGVLGNFPTCLGGPSPFIYHLGAAAPNGYFGPMVDFELDGNAGICPPPPYNRDECWRPADGDAGLMVPDSYTIVGGAVVACSPNNTCLPLPCSTANWGPDIDIEVHNNTNNVMYVNVLVDWNQDGNWSGAANCISSPAREWILQNHPVPAGFAGPLSVLGPPAFRVGPQSGYVWNRFSITEVPIGAVDWNGQGMFDRGESEDYLLCVKPLVGDFGDAPEGALAYPSGVVGRFPTCILVGPAGFIYHQQSAIAWFGPNVDFETDGNAGTCSFPNYDQDECGAPGGDAGLILPEPYTITPALTFKPCPPLVGTPLGWRCLTPSRWGVQADIRINNTMAANAYLNVLVDWNQDGTWGGSMACPGGPGTPEHLVQNLIVPGGFAGKISDLTTAQFDVPSAPGFVWTRFTISETPVPANWNGEGFFQLGETEDYLLRVDDTTSGAIDAERPLPGKVEIESASPNPFNPATAIAWRMTDAGPARLTIHDLAGRLVRTLVDGSVEAGRHTTLWDGADDRGQPLSSGIYVVRLSGAGLSRTMKITMLK